ncbi:exported protein of unknown function [Pseudomonas sp. JV551A1]|uniref:Uncharacterized protein n=1 Tax=Pseudomonas inefficax TaxID=2078786 RepID=A0AAQ1PAB0_9PSED|nr:exported protein of unknown function [Pseudomonas sp. JV551A1]SPO62072.1 exported protein of unknown function [Pseudomonas inefficax]
MKTLVLCFGCFLLFMMVVAFSVEFRVRPNLSAGLNSANGCQHYNCALPAFNPGWTDAFR